MWSKALLQMDENTLKYQVERMQAEMGELNTRKAALKAELQKAQREERDYAAMRQNVEDFLSPPQPEQERKKNVRCCIASSGPLA